MTLLEDRLGITYDEWRTLQADTRRVVTHACLRKERYERNDAIRAARRLRTIDPGIRWYPCPFCHTNCHLGHVPSMRTVAELALAIRDLHGDRPAKKAAAV